MEPTEQEVTAFIDALDIGEEMGVGDLFASAYAELRGVARDQRRNWSGLETLSTTAVVHEAYLKLAQQDAPAWRDRGHFFRIAARAMRFILIDYAERSRAAKRGGGRRHLPVDEALLADTSQLEEMLALHQALARLERRSRRWAQVVECRVFAGLGVEETAEALGVSPTTVKRDWRYAQAWLYEQLET